MPGTNFSTLPPITPGLIAALQDACGSVASRATDRLAAAHDASHYLLTPQAVVTPSSGAEVAALMAAARSQQVSLTFRSGGTSLSGQAGTGDVIVDTRRAFRAITVLENGERVRIGPGATVRQVNARLARYQRKIGPDPASEIACTIGGVVANNSSGMACGITANTYRTLDSMVFILPSGTVIDTGAPAADQTFRAKEPVLYAGLERLRDRIRADAGAVSKIRDLYAIKNTMGYGVNSFVDFTSPLDIFAHLIIGSEGTLAFVSEVTFNTVPVKPLAATGLLIFPDLAAATRLLPALVDTGAATIELMDATSLRVIQRDAEATNELRDLAIVDHAALLVEFQEDSAAALANRRQQASDLLATATLAGSAELSTDPQTRTRLWHLRKGLFTAVAGNRPAGTTALLEDIAVPTDRLYATCAELTELFGLHGYQDSVIFGHAKDGNIHFMINERFDEPESLARYAAFTEDMVSLVLEMGGTLKAEHGTGRIMAPYVRRQVGDDLYRIMQEVKSLADPAGILNPGVLLTDDDQAHLNHLKISPAVESEVDRCVECGYCEPVCPSKDLTMTPRERIVIRREIARARASNDIELLRQLEREYQYDGVQTCAVDGMCETACPVLINTGDLVRRLRAENQNTLAAAGWNTTARRWDAVGSAFGTALTVAKALPSMIPRVASTTARAIIGNDLVPHYSADLPTGGSKRERLVAATPAAIYFPSCTNTMFGPVGADGVSVSLRQLCERAGFALATPDDVPSLCCGTPWKSKGFTDGYQHMRDAVAASLRRASRGGKLPVICDASSCTEGLEVLLAAADLAEIRVIDAVEFVDEHVLARLPEIRKIESVTVHPTCSSTRLGINPALIRVAEAVADTVHIPDDWGCCAFAGDRGMLHPELTALATEVQAGQIVANATVAYASLNRTCELGMTRATGEPYRHILQLLADGLGASND